MSIEVNLLPVVLLWKSPRFQTWKTHIPWNVMYWCTTLCNRFCVATKSQILFDFFSFQFAWCFVWPINNRSLIRSQHFFKNYNILITIQEIHKCDSERPQPMLCIISFYSMAYVGLSPAVRSQSFTSRKREPIWTTIMKWNRFTSNKFNVITKIEAKTSQMQI